jgi:predicted aspartyl protease
MNERSHLSSRGIGFVAWLLLALPVSANMPIRTEWRKEAVRIAEHAGEVVVRRDAHGRLRAPVYINGAGPFDFIVDTGANGSAVAAAVVERLGLTQSREVLLRGVTGSEKARAVLVESLSVGDLTASPVTLPILNEALDGADGFLGTGSFSDKSVLLDLRRNVIAISASRVSTDANAIPIDLSRAGLVFVAASMNGKAVTAIIDTGAGGTIGNRALLALILDPQPGSRADRIVGSTSQMHSGDTYALPPVKLGSLSFAGARVSIADLSLFAHFALGQQPALLIGMDMLGGLDSLSIDYGARTLRLRARSPSPATLTLGPRGLLGMDPHTD